LQNFDEEFESTSRRVPEFAPIFRQSPKDEPARFRPVMPKNKFEILKESIFMNLVSGRSENFLIVIRKATNINFSDY
jgi:hypothetical protein